MKLSAISIALALALSSIAGVASAAGQNKVLHEITVTAPYSLAGCTPSQDRHSQACEDLLAAIHSRFTAWQLGLIHRPTTVHAPFEDTGARERLVNRYVSFLQAYEREHVANQPGADVDVAAE